jgi:hypothetical protein
VASLFLEGSRKTEVGNMFIIIINTKSRVVYIITTCDILINFGQINWPDNFDGRLYNREMIEKVGYI